MGCLYSSPASVHPTTTIRSNVHWLEPTYHDNKKTVIVRPDVLESNLDDPPSPGERDVLDRICGSLIGLALGDAVGAHVEFRPHQYLVEHPVTDLQGGGTWGLQKGQFTDDTSMALCLAASLISCRKFNAYDQLVRYKWWFRKGYMSSTGQCFDIGAATKQALEEFERRQQIFSKKTDIPIENLDYLHDLDLLKQFPVDCGKSDAAGNGGLMRLAPVPLFFFRDPKKAVEYSGHSATITHGDRKAFDACRYYGALIVAALHGESKEKLLHRDFYRNHLDWFSNMPLHDDVREVAEGSYKLKNGYEDGIRGKGYVIDSLKAALWAFWSDEGSFEKGTLAAVNLGDDTDTTAAIYGQLAGAYYGYKGLPLRWVNHVYAGRFIICLSKWIAFEGRRWIERRSTSSITPKLTSKL